MKTTLTAIAIVMAFVPTLATAGGVVDVLHRQTAPVDNHGINDAFGDKPTINSPVHIDVDKPVIHSDVDVFPDEPVIHTDVDIFPDGPDKPIIHKTPFGDIALACDVAGTPVEFPNDLVITNIGLKSIDTGTLLKWTIKSPNAHGVFTLNETLDPGESIKLKNILGSGLSPETPCSVKAA